MDLAQRLKQARVHGREKIDAVLAGFASIRTARAFLQRAADEDAPSPDALRAILEALPGDHLPHLLDAMAIEQDPARRKAVRPVLVAIARERPDDIVGRLETAPPGMVKDLAEVLVTVAPARRVELAGKLMGRGDPECLEGLLYLLAEVRPKPTDKDALVALSTSMHVEARVRSLELLGDLKDKTVYGDLSARLIAGAQGSMPNKEAAAVGRALGRLDPATATPTLIDWIRPRNLIKRWFSVPKNEILHYAAVTGLADINIGEHEEVIRWLMPKAGSDLQDHCTKVIALAKRRERPRG